MSGQLVLTLEVVLYAEDERDAEKKIHQWLLAQEDNDDLIYYEVTDWQSRP